MVPHGDARTKAETVNAAKQAVTVETEANCAVLTDATEI
jgi:hypothetical protein